jgi:hypothetical protein
MSVPNVIVCRLQGGVAPVSSRSSEEKQMVPVAVTTQQPISLEAPSHMITRTGLTESSSSSKLVLCASDNTIPFVLCTFNRTSLTETF